MAELEPGSFGRGANTPGSFICTLDTDVRKKGMMEQGLL